MKKYSIVAEGELVDAEFNTNDRDEAERIYTQFANSTEYRYVSLASGETGELFKYRTLKFEHGGVERTEWVALPF